MLMPRETPDPGSRSSFPALRAEDSEFGESAIKMREVVVPLRLPDEGLRRGRLQGDLLKGTERNKPLSDDELRNLIDEQPSIGSGGLGSWGVCGVRGSSMCFTPLARPIDIPDPGSRCPRAGGRAPWRHRCGTAQRRARIARPLRFPSERLARQHHPHEHDALRIEPKEHAERGNLRHACEGERFDE